MLWILVYPITYLVQASVYKHMIIFYYAHTCYIPACSFQAVAKLRTIDWMPFVVFVKPSNVDSLRRMNDQAINEGVDTARKSVSLTILS